MSCLPSVTKFPTLWGPPLLPHDEIDIEGDWRQWPELFRIFQHRFCNTDFATPWSCHTKSSVMQGWANRGCRQRRVSKITLISPGRLVIRASAKEDQRPRGPLPGRPDSFINFGFSLEAIMWPPLMGYLFLFLATLFALLIMVSVSQASSKEIVQETHLPPATHPPGQENQMPFSLEKRRRRPSGCYTGNGGCSDCVIL